MGPKVDRGSKAMVYADGKFKQNHLYGVRLCGVSHMDR